MYFENDSLSIFLSDSNSFFKLTNSYDDLRAVFHDSEQERGSFDKLKINTSLRNRILNLAQKNRAAYRPLLDDLLARITLDLFHDATCRIRDVYKSAFDPSKHPSDRKPPIFISPELLDVVSILDLWPGPPPDLPIAFVQRPSNLDHVLVQVRTCILLSFIQIKDCSADRFARFISAVFPEHVLRNVQYARETLDDINEHFLKKESLWENKILKYCDKVVLIDALKRLFTCMKTMTSYLADTKETLQRCQANIEQVTHCFRAKLIFPDGSQKIKEVFAAHRSPPADSDSDSDSDSESESNSNSECYRSLRKRTSPSAHVEKTMAFASNTAAETQAVVSPGTRPRTATDSTATVGVFVSTKAEKKASPAGSPTTPTNKDLPTSIENQHFNDDIADSNALDRGENQEYSSDKAPSKRKMISILNDDDQHLPSITSFLFHFSTHSKKGKVHSKVSEEQDEEQEEENDEQENQWKRVEQENQWKRVEQGEPRKQEEHGSQREQEEHDSQGEQEEHDSQGEQEEHDSQGEQEEHEKQGDHSPNEHESDLVIKDGPASEPEPEPEHDKAFALEHTAARPNVVVDSKAYSLRKRP